MTSALSNPSHNRASCRQHAPYSTALGLSAAVDEIDLADLPERIGEVSASWIAGAIADVAEEDRLEAINRFTADLMAAINRSTAEQ